MPNTFYQLLPIKNQSNLNVIIFFPYFSKKMFFILILCHIFTLVIVTPPASTVGDKPLFGDACYGYDLKLKIII